MKKGLLMILMIGFIFTLSSCKKQIDDQFNDADLDVENSEVDDFEMYMSYLTSITEHVKAYQVLMDEQYDDYSKSNKLVFEDMTVEKSELISLNVEDELKAMTFFLGWDLETILEDLDVKNLPFEEGTEFNLNEEEHIITYANENYFYYREIDTRYDVHYSEWKVKILASGDYIAEHFYYKRSEDLELKETAYWTMDTRKGFNQIAMIETYDSLNMGVADFDYINGEYKAIEMYDYGLQQVNYMQVRLNEDDNIKTRFIKNVVGLDTTVYEVSGFSDEYNRVYKYSETHEQTGNIRKNLVYSLAEVDGWTNIEDGVMMNGEDEINTLGSIFQSSGEFINYIYDPLQKETFLTPHEGLSIDVDFDYLIETLDYLKIIINDYGYTEDDHLTYGGVTFTTFEELMEELYKDLPEEYKEIIGLST